MGMSWTLKPFLRYVTLALYLVLVKCSLLPFTPLFPPALCGAPLRSVAWKYQELGREVPYIARCHNPEHKILAPLDRNGTYLYRFSTDISSLALAFQRGSYHPHHDSYHVLFPLNIAVYFLRKCLIITHDWIQLTQDEFALKLHELRANSGNFLLLLHNNWKHGI